MKEFSLGDILGNLREKFSPGSSSKERIRKILSQIVGAEIGEKTLTLKGKTIFLQLPPVLKNELYLKKKECLDALLAEGFYFDDIR